MLAAVKKNVHIQYITQLIQWGQIGDNIDQMTILIQRGLSLEI